RHVVGADERIAADEILDLGKRAVGDGLLRALDDLAAALERLATIDDVPLGREFLEPRHPLLQHLLRTFRRRRPFAAAIQKHELVHAASLLDVDPYVDSTTLEAGGGGQFFSGVGSPCVRGPRATASTIEEPVASRTRKPTSATAASGMDTSERPEKFAAAI